LGDRLTEQIEQPPDVLQVLDPDVVEPRSREGLILDSRGFD